MKKINVILASLTLFGLMTGCGGSGGGNKNTSENATNESQTAEPETSLTVAEDNVATQDPGKQIYITGKISYDGDDAAALWINGKPNILAPYGSVNAVSGSKDGIVYAVGSDKQATIWKVEGDKIEKIHIANEYSYIDAIYVTEQGDLYMAGSEGDREELSEDDEIQDYWKSVCYWKMSGTKITKMPLKSIKGWAESDIYVAPRAIWASPNGKVYVVGTMEDNNKSRHSAGVAVLWIDGVGQILSEGKYAVAYAIDGTRDGDIYIVGNVGCQAVIWKNQTLQYLTKDTDDCIAWSVFVTDNGDVYAAGEFSKKNELNHAAVWKNGVMQLLPDGARADAIHVTQEGDVYVAGTTSGGAIRLWKNGKLQTLTNGGFYTTGIFVK